MRHDGSDLREKGFGYKRLCVTPPVPSEDDHSQKHNSISTENYNLNSMPPEDM